MRSPLRGRKFYNAKNGNCISGGNVNDRTGNPLQSEMDPEIRG